MTADSRNGAWRRALELTAPIVRDPYRTLPATIHALTQTLGPAPALLSTEETLSYAALGQRMDHYTRWAMAQGLKTGDVVCLLMPNGLDYVAIWLGLTRVGCIVALLNSNLRGTSLARAISVVTPSHVIVSASLSESQASVAPLLDKAIRFWAHGGDLNDIARIDTKNVPDAAPLSSDALKERLPSIRDRALYLYTSGTTGLPKAVPISHYRLMQWSFWFAGMIGVQATDRMYNCLPMYHSVGGIVANGAMLVSGASVVVRERFSASRFWNDLAAMECTLFQYIGEMCRYLVNGPDQSEGYGHTIRMACGNGLRGDVWERLQQRFDIPRILEFYASTEGNISLYNIEGQPGSIGRIPSYLAYRSPMALVRFDFDTERPKRGSDGLCLRSDIDEPGEAIGRIPDDTNSLSGQFEGYLDPVASEAKILRDVFAKGDAWYRTGDLMRRDTAGFYYFVDRIGDTFRWKGENVSTEEVAAAVAACPGVTSAVVFGVTVPDHEGRAGMAAIVVTDDFNLSAFYDLIVARLPDYALPAFLRLSPEIEVTGTFKPQKQQLMRDAYDASVVTDPVYVRDRKKGCFVRLDETRRDLIERGEISF